MIGAPKSKSQSLARPRSSSEEYDFQDKDVLSEFDNGTLELFDFEEELFS